MNGSLFFPWLQKSLPRWCQAALVSAVALSACACGSVNHVARHSAKDPFQTAPGSERQARPQMQETASRDGEKRRPVVAAGGNQDGRPKMRGAIADPAIRPVAHDSYAETDFEPMEAFEARQSVNLARLELPPAGCPAECAVTCEEGEAYPDEYVCDGGDRELPVHYDAENMLGLDSEDTIVEYRDEDGRRRVKPSTRTCIYAPRFGSVVSVSAPLEGVTGGRLSQTVVQTPGAGLHGRSVPIAQKQQEMSERMTSRSRGSSVRTSVGAIAEMQPVAVKQNIHTVVPRENESFLRTGIIRSADEPWLATQIQSAHVWTRNEFPVITASTSGANELRSRFNVAEMNGLENRFNGKSRLRIVKLADKETAEPGDVVTFTIRFDNLGDKGVDKVVIIDNLTPRLEYVEGSATCDLDSQLVIEENGEGSLILRWELAEPLAGRTGGVATFQARVR
jgi:uncharacterized repeat protein (TIGR01451 family)